MYIKQKQQQKRHMMAAGLCIHLTLLALFLNMCIGHPQVSALSLISEKCDPSKVGPDETTVKGGWQAEMFNGLAFRACGK